MPNPTIAARIVSRIIELAEERGAPRGALLEASDLDAQDLENGDYRVALSAHLRLLRDAKTLCRDPAFALHYGEAVNLAEVSIVGLIGYACETLIEAFSQLQRYSRLLMDFDLGSVARFTLETDGEGMWIVDNRPDPNEAPELTEIAFAQMVTGTRRFGDTPFVLAVHVTHPDPGYRGEYERVLGAPVTFSSDRNAMLIDQNWITKPVSVEPRYAFGIFTKHADSLMERLQSSASVTARVEAALLPVLHTGDTKIERIAGRVGLSRDTLYRRLRGEGTTFEKVLDGLRHRLAMEYIGGGKTSVHETAYLLGYSDPAAFSRAFKRWTRESPRELRNRSSFLS